ncbi:MAG: pyruvate, phosphate dikinase [Deltaproteobacteria bacterium]|nr:pyruvate, phosphate dikinase [Deltaproteobacteria bacterium]MBW1948599.1 pyruvate, phosphate dikinase [Deltaproteobacteria bacterium]
MADLTEKIPSEALQANIITSRVQIRVDDRYAVLEEAMGPYHGVREGIRSFIEELCHPYRNWGFIVKEARGYALNYLHVLASHPSGREAAERYVEILLEALEKGVEEKVRRAASDTLLLMLQKIAQDRGAVNGALAPVLDRAFRGVLACGEEPFFYFVSSFYPLKRLARGAAGEQSGECDPALLERLLSRYYLASYDYWLNQPDPLSFFKKESGLRAARHEVSRIFEGITHDALRRLRRSVEEKVDPRNPAPNHERVLELSGLPGYQDIVRAYNQVPRRLFAAGGEGLRGNQWKLLFLLHIMRVPGLASIHEETLREINWTIAWLIDHEASAKVRASLRKTFSILGESVGRFPQAALQCVLNMGRGVYRTDDSDLVEFFIDQVVSLGFQGPELEGIGEDWQVRANPAHVQNIRTWLQLVELNPKWSKKLLSCLTIHLALEGVFIRDTDLFPRDITDLLNAEIGPVYHQVKQLIRLFPIYFNEIGAEGRLRDVSTRIDEVSLRKDPLIHFLRKQSHVESSNETLVLMEAVLRFWKTGDKAELEGCLPPSVHEMVAEKGPQIDGVRKVMERLFEELALSSVEELLRVHPARVAALDLPGGCNATDRERVALAVDFYRLLNQKYRLAFADTEALFASLRGSGLPGLEKVKEILEETDLKKRIDSLLEYQEQLKEIVLSERRYEIHEDIYRKRHFTVDIPSMYGSYHEMKFDAMALILRIDSLLNVLFEELAGSLDLRIITRATFSEVLDCIRFFLRALRLEGLSSLEMEKQVELLEHAMKVRGFTSTQYLDIFKGFSQAVGRLVNGYFSTIHQENIMKILDRLPIQRLERRYRLPEGGEDRDGLIPRVTEIFMRERIAASLGLQQLDLFLTRVLNTLHRQAQELPPAPLHLLLTYDPKLAVTPLYEAKEAVSDIIHLGNKGFNLLKLVHYGLPVPPGFIVTTEIFRCRAVVEGYGPAKRNFQDQIMAEIRAIEQATGRRFGDPRAPLLFSVRSGSAISQPGMMSTFLNVGINEEVVEGIIRAGGSDWFAWDTYRRFLQTYGMAFDMDRDIFDEVIEDFKQRTGAAYKKEFPGRVMKEVALAYKSLILEAGVPLQEQPFLQLMVAVGKVLESWDGPKARIYREIMGISEDWGTAVTVQAMVYGNRSKTSGAGVFFTHSPRWRRDLLIPWGDYTIGNQGEDVVSGLVRTLPISRKQAEIENRDPETALESGFPEIYTRLREWAKELIYEKKWSPQEMEFTFEGPKERDLYFLQTRDMMIREKMRVSSFDVPPDAPLRLLGHGIGVSGGAMAGRVVFTAEEIRRFRREDPGVSLILLRNDTVPDDINEINAADGLLTARGGSTSHAAIVAHRLGKTCVVGCPELQCRETEKECTLNRVTLRSGDMISIHGTEGSIFAGVLPVREEEIP